MEVRFESMVFFWDGQIPENAPQPCQRSHVGKERGGTETERKDVCREART